MLCIKGQNKSLFTAICSSGNRYLLPSSKHKGFTSIGSATAIAQAIVWKTIIAFKRTFLCGSMTVNHVFVEGSFSRIIWPGFWNLWTLSGSAPVKVLREDKIRQKGESTRCDVTPSSLSTCSLLKIQKLSFWSHATFRLYSSTFQVILYGKMVKIKQNLLGMPFVKINSFVSYIFSINTGVLNFGDLRTEFLISSFLQKSV